MGTGCRVPPCLLGGVTGSAGVVVVNCQTTPGISARNVSKKPLRRTAVKTKTRLPRGFFMPIARFSGACYSLYRRGGRIIVWWWVVRGPSPTTHHTFQGASLTPPWKSWPPRLPHRDCVRNQKPRDTDVFAGFFHASINTTTSTHAPCSCHPPSQTEYRQQSPPYHLSWQA